MTTKTSAAEWLEWQTERSNRKHFRRPFVGSRAYPHFDAPISLKNRPAVRLLIKKLENPRVLEKWPFFPFIKVSRSQRKFIRSQAEDIGTANPLHLPSRINQKKFSHIKTRALMASAHQDACIFSFYCFGLEKKYEKYLKDNSIAENVLAYRSVFGKNNVDFARDAFEHITKSNKSTCLLFDISGFFDSINHKKLVDAIEELSPGKTKGWQGHVLRNLTSYRYIPEDTIYNPLRANKKRYLVRVPGTKNSKICKLEDYKSVLENKATIKINKTGVGIPQGSPASGLLANIFLSKFDKEIANSVAKHRHGYYRRYSDDILIVCPTSESIEMYNTAKLLLGQHDLKLKASKTEAFVYSKGQLSNSIYSIEPSLKNKPREMQYLGLHWDGRRIVLRPSTVARRYRPTNPLYFAYWGYSKMALLKIRQKGIRKQNLRVRRTVKKKIDR